MRIERLIVRNFRALENIDVEVDPNMTVLVGANNVGKTSVLEALGAVLAFHRGALPFSELDFRSVNANADVRAAPSIEIHVHLAPSGAATRFESGETGDVTPQVRADGAERVFLRLDVKFDDDPSVPSLAYTLSLLKEDGNPTGGEPLSSFPFRERLPLHAFGTERNLRRGLGGRWSDWGRIISEARPDEAVRTEAMRLLREGSEHLISKTPELATIERALGDVGTAIGLDGAKVKLMAASQDVEELLNNVAIDLQMPAVGRGFRAERHGLGTQGALLFAIYRHQIDRLRTQLHSVSPVLTIEEPEAHLHPTAQRAMAHQLARLPGQVIVASHSPELLTAENSRTVVLRSKGGRSIACAARSDLRHHVKEHTKALFARCILVAEGLESEAIEVCASAMGLDLASLGVELINARGQGSVKSLWEVFGPSGYDAPIVCMADGDDATQLDHFIAALVKAGLIGQTPAPSDRSAVLATHDYFVAADDMSIEEMLVAHDGATVDRAHARRGEDDLPAWRAAHSTQKLGGRDQKRFGKLRGTQGVEPMVVGDLSDDEARTWRMCRAKGEGVIRDVFRVLTQDGTDPSKIPPSHRRALERVSALAKGSR